MPIANYICSHFSRIHKLSTQSEKAGLLFILSWKLLTEVKGRMLLWGAGHTSYLDAWMKLTHVLHLFIRSDPNWNQLKDFYWNSGFWIRPRVCMNRQNGNSELRRNFSLDFKAGKYIYKCSWCDLPSFCQIRLCLGLDLRSLSSRTSRTFAPSSTGKCKCLDLSILLEMNNVK